MSCVFARCLGVAAMALLLSACTVRTMGPPPQQQPPWSIVDQLQMLIESKSSKPLEASVALSNGSDLRTVLEKIGGLSGTTGNLKQLIDDIELAGGPGLTGLMLACLLAALMSSVDAYMIVGSALMVRNVYAPYFNPAATEAEYVRLARVTGLLVGISMTSSL